MQQTVQDTFGDHGKYRASVTVKGNTKNARVIINAVLDLVVQHLERVLRPHITHTLHLDTNELIPVHVNDTYVTRLHGTEVRFTMVLDTLSMCPHAQYIIREDLVGRVAMFVTGALNADYSDEVDASARASRNEQSGNPVDDLVRLLFGGADGSLGVDDLFARAMDYESGKSFRNLVEADFPFGLDGGVFSGLTNNRPSHPHGGHPPCGC